MTWKLTALATVCFLFGFGRQLPAWGQTPNPGTSPPGIATNLEAGNPPDVSPEEDANGNAAHVMATIVDSTLGAHPLPPAPARQISSTSSARPRPAPACTYRRLTPEEIAALATAGSAPERSPSPPAPAPGSAPLLPSPTPEPMPGVFLPPPVAVPPTAPSVLPALQVAAPNLGHPPDELAFWEVCGGQVVGLVWFKIPTPRPAPTPAPARPSKPTVAAVATLYSLATAVVAAPIKVGSDPAGFGITGMPSYFWVAGYDGSPLSASVHGVDPATGRAATIEIRAILSHFVWDFGDGAALTTTSLGSPYPAVSDIAHTYDVRSDRSPMAHNGAYQVRLSAVFDVAYRVAAPGLSPSGWIAFADSGLGPITSTSEHDHKVVEVRSVLTADPVGG